MIRFSAALLACALMVSSAQAVTVTVGDSTAPWLGFMNVFNTPADGGGLAFAQGWGVPDLTTVFDDANSKLTYKPVIIDTPDAFWYTNGTGGPGATGNKVMESNLFIQETGTLSGQTVTFEGEILSDTTTAGYQGNIFIRDFASDFSSFNETLVPITPGPFSISLATINDPTRNVQYGFQMVGLNVWSTDVDNFGNIMIGPSAAPIPEPSSVLLVGAGLLGLVGSRRRS